jgi:hypothetical protein
MEKTFETHFCCLIEELQAKEEKRHELGLILRNEIKQ